jgi:hypothetical protein
MKYHRDGTKYPEIPDFEGANPKPAPVAESLGGALLFIWFVVAIIWILHALPDAAELEQWAEEQEQSV